jgi:hypothetical protein
VVAHDGAVSGGGAVGGRRAHGSGAAAAGARVGRGGDGRAGRGVDLSHVREREREAGHAAFFCIRQ